MGVLELVDCVVNVGCFAIAAYSLLLVGNVPPAGGAA